MSKTKETSKAEMTKEVKSEGGDMKMKSKPKIKKFNTTKEEPVKVDLAKDPNVKIEEPTKVDLTKTNPGIQNVIVGLGWDTNKYDGSSAFDLDSAAFLTDASGKVTSDTDFIFFNNLVHSSKSVTHLGDNLTGEGDGDDEQLKINIPLIPENIEKISFSVTIH